MKVDKTNVVTITRMQYNDLIRKADAFMTIRNMFAKDDSPYSTFNIDKSVFNALCDTVDAYKREVMETASKLGSLMGDLFNACGNDDEKGKEE